MKTLLVIGHTFPEPKTTAAGDRMMQLLSLFQEDGFQITFASTAVVSEKTANLKELGISIQNISLNDASFDVFVKKLDPDVVIFDRYISEEQFGWRVSDQCPQAIKILDTEDLHFLRKAREEAVKNNAPIAAANLFSDLAKRELASILRCDLSLIISEFEMELLQWKFNLSPNILFYLPFLISDTSEKINTPSFADRKDFVTIGNLLHAPNVDSVLELKNMWPEIRKHLPKTELHIYGVYAPKQIAQLHNKKEGFIIKGWLQDLDRTLPQYRLQLAPLRFGAGLKGKLVDAMRLGLPSITTEVGAEGLCGDMAFGGAITYSNEDFIEKAVGLYSDENLWDKASDQGYKIIRKRFQKKLFAEEFYNRLHSLSKNLEVHRQKNFMGQILQHQSMQATKYMSKWIEAKNTPVQNTSPVCYANSDEVRDEYK